MKKPKLIDDWQHAHHLGSVQVAAIGALLSGIGLFLSGVGDIAPWLNVATQWINTIPRWVIWGGGMLFCVAFIVVRLFRKRRAWECDERNNYR